jgi:hypothetical protein
LRVAIWVFISAYLVRSKQLLLITFLLFTLTPVVLPHLRVMSVVALLAQRRQVQ